MTQQYGRSASIVVSKNDGSGIDFAKFKCEFRVTRGDTQTPNSCDVRIYNLTQSTAQLLNKPEFTTLTVVAGYSNAAQIFSGDIKQVRLGRTDQKDSYVDITAADGDEAYNFATCALQWAASDNPSYLNQIQALIATMARFGITQGYLPPFSTNTSVRGVSHYGATRDALRLVADQTQCTWSIQDNKVCFIPKTYPIPSGLVPVISPSTGLIGTPQQTPNGIEMRTLLNPTYKIGQVVKLDQSVTINGLRIGLDPGSVALTNTGTFGNIGDPNVPTQAQITGSGLIAKDGLYYVMRADYTGDTRGEDWYTDLICLAVNASQPLDVSVFSPVGNTAGSIPRY